MSKEGRAFLVVVLALICTGLVMTYSASALYADQKFKHAGYFLMRQIISVMLGFFVLLFCSRINPFWFRKKSYVGLLWALALLLLVFVPVISRPAGGARRWIGLLGFRFQPSEWAKMAMCIYLSDYLVRKQSWLRSGHWRVFIGPGIIFSVMAGTIIIQPDFGAAVMLLVIAISLFFLAGTRLRYICGGMAAACPVILYLILSKPYRWSRIVAFLNPWQDPRGTGFQIIQSYLAFGLGGFHGVGLGASTQKLFYLPQSHTDFIFSILGEELGLVGTAGTAFLFVLLLYFGLRISANAGHLYLRLLSFGLVMMITLQAVVNMLVTTGMLPTKGLPLPFLSYGGSALLFNMMGVGIVLAVDRWTVSRCALL